MGQKLFSPEFAAASCARKNFATESNSAMLEQLAHLDGAPWSLKHTIFVDMGGIAIRLLPEYSGDFPTPNQDRQRIFAGTQKDLNLLRIFVGHKVYFWTGLEIFLGICGNTMLSLLPGWKTPHRDRPNQNRRQNRRQIQLSVKPTSQLSLEIFGYWILNNLRLHE